MYEPEEHAAALGLDVIDLDPQQGASGSTSPGCGPSSSNPTCTHTTGAPCSPTRSATTRPAPGTPTPAARSSSAWSTTATVLPRNA